MSTGRIHSSEVRDVAPCDSPIIQFAEKSIRLIVPSSKEMRSLEQPEIIIRVMTVSVFAGNEDGNWRRAHNEINAIGWILKKISNLLEHVYPRVYFSYGRLNR